MPGVSNYKCDKCDFELPSGWGGHSYVTDKDGNRIVCRHPGEIRDARRILAESYPDRAYGLTVKMQADYDKWRQTDPNSFDVHEFVNSRMGFNSYCVCLNCTDQFKLDLRIDEHICPKCGSPDIVPVREMVGKSCPKCHQGTIEEIPTGIWS